MNVLPQPAVETIGRCLVEGKKFATLAALALASRQLRTICQPPCGGSVILWMTG